MTDASKATTLDAPIETSVGGASVIINPASTKPSEQLVAAAEGRVTVTDARGRVFELSKPKVLDQFRMVDALGESAKNEVYMGMVLPLLFISKIDGQVQPRPSHRSQIDALNAADVTPRHDAILVAS